MDHALLREIPDTFDRALVRHGRPELDVQKARGQHLEYQRLIENAGYKLTVLPADPAHPDCLFVEDTVVVIEDTAVVTRPGAASRRGEVAPVAAALSDQLEVIEMSSPGTLDGGDVFIMDQRVFVGRSERTNDRGIDQLTTIANAHGLGVIPMDVSHVLHLKSAVHPVDHETVVVKPGTVDESLLVDLRVVHEHPSERYRFSSLILRTGEVVVTDAAPRTSALVTDLGLDLMPIDVSEIQAADGGLTCMSVFYGSE